MKSKASKLLQDLDLDVSGHNILRLEWSPTIKKFRSLVNQHPLMYQLTKEAGIKVGTTVDSADYDKLLQAAGKHGITVETATQSKLS